MLSDSGASSHFLIKCLPAVTVNISEYLIVTKLMDNSIILSIHTFGSHHFANGGSRYVSSNNLCEAFGKKGGHLLGNTTSLPPWLFLLEQQVGNGFAVNVTALPAVRRLCVATSGGVCGSPTIRIDVESDPFLELPSAEARLKISGYAWKSIQGPHILGRRLRFPYVTLSRSRPEGILLVW